MTSFQFFKYIILTRTSGSLDTAPSIWYPLHHCQCHPFLRKCLIKSIRPSRVHSCIPPFFPISPAVPETTQVRYSLYCQGTLPFLIIAILSFTGISCLAVSLLHLGGVVGCEAELGCLYTTAPPIPSTMPGWKKKKWYSIGTNARDE